MDLTGEEAGSPAELPRAKKGGDFAHPDEAPCYDTDEEQSDSGRAAAAHSEKGESPATPLAQASAEEEREEEREEAREEGREEEMEERGDVRSVQGEEDGVSCSASDADLLRGEGEGGEETMELPEKDTREGRKRGKEETARQDADIYASCPQALVEEMPDGSKIRSALQRPVLGVLVGDTYFIKVTNEDAAFIIGRGGSTKKKIAGVSGCRVELEDNGLRLDVTGTEEQRERALLYIRLIMQQRLGPVRWNSERNDMCTEGVARLFQQQDEEADAVKAPRKDLTVLEIPSEAVAYVTGSNGQVLRRIEDEWRTLMFFTQQERGAGKGAAAQTAAKRSGRRAEADEKDAPDAKEDAETGAGEHDKDAATLGGKMEELLIFGSERSRVGASLKVMSAVDQKLRGFYTRRLTAALALREEARRQSACSRRISAEQREREGGREATPRDEKKEEMEDAAEAEAKEVKGEKEEVKGEMEDVADKDREKEAEEKEGKELEKVNGDDDGEADAKSSTDRGDVFGEILLTTTLENICAPGQSFWDTLQEANLEEQKEESTRILVDIIKIEDRHFSYCLGREGKTRRKLASAAGCMLEYIGRFAFAAGTLAERRRVQEYLACLVRQREKPIFLSDICRDGEFRPDLTVMDIPREKAALVTWRQGNALRDVEERTGTFCFFEGRRGGKPGAGSSGSASEERKKERLLIFGTSAEGRSQAVLLVRRLLGFCGERGRRGEPRMLFQNPPFFEPFQPGPAALPFFPSEEGLLPPGPLGRRNMGMPMPFLETPRILPGPHTSRVPVNLLPPRMSLLGRQKVPGSIPLLPGDGVARALSPRRAAFEPSLLLAPPFGPGLFPGPDDRVEAALGSRRSWRGASPERTKRSHSSRFAPYGAASGRGLARGEEDFFEPERRGLLREGPDARGPRGVFGEGGYREDEGYLRRGGSSVGGRASFLPTVLPAPSFELLRGHESGYGAYAATAGDQELARRGLTGKASSQKGGYGGVDREREKDTFRGLSREEERRAAYLGESEGDWAGRSRYDDREKCMYTRDRFGGRGEEQREGYPHERRGEGSRRKEERRRGDEGTRRHEEDESRRRDEETRRNDERRKDERSRRDEYFFAHGGTHATLAATGFEGKPEGGRSRYEDEAFLRGRGGGAGEVVVGKNGGGYGRDDRREKAEGDAGRRRYADGDEFPRGHKPYRHYREEEEIERSRANERQEGERPSKRRAALVEDCERSERAERRRDETRHHGYAAEAEEESGFGLLPRDERGPRSRRGLDREGHAAAYERADPEAGGGLAPAAGGGRRRPDERGSYHSGDRGRENDRRDEEYTSPQITACDYLPRRRAEEGAVLAGSFGGSAGPYAGADPEERQGRRRSRSPGGGPYLVGYGGYSTRTSATQNTPSAHVYAERGSVGERRRREREDEALAREAGRDEGRQEMARRKDEDRSRATAVGRRDRSDYAGRGEEQRREEVEATGYEQRHRGYRTARDDRV
ncbi:UNVERIFIED_CONTAM: hypothetical protein HHA_209210 [Hammondia hammondi]|eukprot:XP_008887017.1 hypothetical protein HHA_209210 [Hammondia hammondi]